MTWLAFRQYRMEMVIAFALLSVLGTFVLYTGTDMAAAYQRAGLEACEGVTGEACARTWSRFIDTHSSFLAISEWLQFFPVVLGVLLAAPTVLEFEQRTYRLAWTQSITRNRWLWTRIGLAAIGAALFAAIITAFMTWWYQPFDRMEGRFANGYNFQGVVPVFHTLFALGAAVAIGALTRRSIVAFSATVIAFLIVRLGIEFVLRPSFMTPKEAFASGGGSPTLPQGAWPIESTSIDSSGRPVADMDLLRLCDGMIVRGNGDLSIMGNGLGACLEANRSPSESSISLLSGSGSFSPSKRRYFSA